MITRLAFLIVFVLIAGCVKQAPGSKSAGDSTGSRKSPTSRPSGTLAKVKPAEEAKASNPSAVAAADRLDVEVYDHFGDGVAKGTEAITLAMVAANPKEYVGKKIRLTGKVASVCKEKGCWMVLTDGPTKVRIKFRAYGFFMPLDCEGREAILDGSFDVTEMSIAEIKHLLEDEDKHAEAEKVDKPRNEFTVMADGVALKK